MDILDGLDFESVGDLPEAFDYQPLSPYYAQLIKDIETGSRNGDLIIVIEAFFQLRASNAESSVLCYPGSSLRLAIEHQHRQIVHYLLMEGAQISANHAKLATIKQDRSILLLLFKYGWAINTPLSRLDPPALAYAIEDLELTNWFLAHGANPNVRCGLDRTPLSAAVQYGSLAVIQRLFECGGDITQGQLLHHAVWRDTDRLAVVNYLLDKGALVNKVMYEDDSTSYLQHEAFGLGTPLHKAAALGDFDVLLLLLGKGANVHIKDTLGFSACDRARANGHDMVVDHLSSL